MLRQYGAVPQKHTYKKYKQHKTNYLEWLQTQTEVQQTMKSELTIA